MTATRRRRDQHRPAAAPGRRGPLRPAQRQDVRQGQRGPDRALGRCHVRRRGRGHRGPQRGLRPGGRHAARGRFAHRRQQATRRGGNVIEFDRAVYSPCPLCARARAGPCGRSRRGGPCSTKTAQTVTYRDARLEMFGLPIAYTPWFRHPAPGREAAVRLPDADLRLAPPNSGSSRRSPTTTCWTRARTSPSRRSSPRTAARCWPASTAACTATATRSSPARGTYASSRRERRRQRAGRTASAATSAATAATRSATHSQAGFDIYLGSDKPFSTATRSTMPTSCAAASIWKGSRQRDFWSLNGYYFQGLRPFDDQDTIPVALPLAETRLVSDRMRWGSLLDRGLATCWR